MKRFSKISVIIIASLIGVILLVAVLIKSFEDNIAHITANKLSYTIAAPITISTVDFNLLRSYPNSKIELNDVNLKSPKDSNNIAHVKRLFLSVNSKKAMQGSYEINAIELDSLNFNYNISKDSLTNLDFLLALFETTSTVQDSTINDAIPDSVPLQINLKQLLMKNIICSYFDSTSMIGAKVFIPEIVINANVNGDNYSATSKGQLKITDIRFGEYNTQLIDSTLLKYDIDYEGDHLKINNLTFESDGLALAMTGKANLGDTLNIEAYIKNSFIDIAKLISYAPQAMLDEYGITEAQGQLTFSSNITGIYSDSTMPQMDLDFALNNAALKTKDYPEIKHFSIRGNANNGISCDNTTTSLDIDQLQVKTAQSTLNATAHIKNIDQPTYNISSDGSLLIDEFAAFIPDTLLEYITGKINWNFTTYGTVPQEIDDAFTDKVLAQSSLSLSTKDLSLKMDSSLTINNLNTSAKYKKQHFTLKSLSVEVPSYDVAIQNAYTDVRFEGSVNELSSLLLNIDSLLFESDSNILCLNGTVKNMDQPIYDLKGKVELNLKQLQKFAPDTLIRAMSGKVKMAVVSQGEINLDSISDQAMDIAFKQSSFKLECEDVALQMVDSLYDINKMNLKANMQHDSIAIDSFFTDYKGLTMALNNTYILNAYKAAILNQEEKLIVRSNINFGDINYAILEPFMLTDSLEEITTDTTESEYIQHYTMDIKGDMAINSFTLDNYEVDTDFTIHHFKIDDFSTKFRVTDSTYIADSLQFYAFDGFMNSSLRYDIKKDKIGVAMRSHIDSMNFKTLLYEMNNFGQTDLTEENISGLLSADVFAEAFIVGDTIPQDRMRMRGDFTLENGGIYNFEPAQEMSKFTGINELDNIRFQTLKTKLFLFKGAAYVPETNIVSSAIDVKAYGMQTLGDDYEYHLDLNLGDVLTGKSENLMKRQEKANKEAGDDVKRNGVNLIVYSLDGKTKNGFDNKKAQDKMKRKIKLQQRVLDLVFNPKLFNFDTEFEIAQDETNKK